MPLFATLLAALLLLAPSGLIAAEPALPTGCDGFAWDVRHELALLQTAGDSVQAATAARILPTSITLDVRHNLALHPQQQTTLAAKPGKPMLEDDATAGMVAFRVPADGRYRIALTTGHWLDVVDAGKVVPSLDFQGRRSCPLVHKIVEFQLPAGRNLILQLSGGSDPTAGVVVSAAPATQ